MIIKYVVLPLFLLFISCAAQPIDRIATLPVPKHPDVLNECVEKYTGEKINFYQSYSSVTVLEDFFNIKALNIIDNNGVFHIINELELPNYECTVTQIP